ncbi:hypothetical protein EUGRSUZ_C04022 [Eucalyptus grandis]|uniref:Uncharacterized protein n=2 Tax=Eucalyptus grandis TaxID=71139 RepID=A0ACC3LMK6_EUCGR|nr:hypothetical protein EUGRSUZ_C04022 [Eucalyptus grandis]
MRILADTTYAPLSVAMESTPPAVPTASQQSPCHSPMPYLFVSLAAMLGLIGFTLLILACSYRRLSGSLSSTQGDEENGGEARTVDREGYSKAVKVHEEKVAVIMAGEERPTFLATPGRVKAIGRASTPRRTRMRTSTRPRSLTTLTMMMTLVATLLTVITQQPMKKTEEKAAEDQTQLQN